ncbi:Transcription factor IIB [Only Syngen Nebraska virus 5]|uniref:Transcription factor IIB n=1 Tax=Only Syngen Nebraska virus 5 TaxID=1917232 RepID=UPI0009010D69|nr:Transcription factor IIB [Only Syngen Nebraska virus 5]APC25555.1 Transcription factor IIB [Only Syngen Nebraska virus 5]
MYFKAPELERGGCYCEVPTTIYDSMTGFDVCTTCGVVLEMVLDETPDYQYDDAGADMGHYGLAGASLGTMIDTHSTLTKRLEASLADKPDLVIQEIKNIAAQVCQAIHIRIPHVIYDTSVEIAKLHRDKIYLSGGKKIASIAMSVYFACKLHNSDREIRLFSSACSIDMKLLNSAIKSIKETLKDTKYMTVANSDNKYYALVTQFIGRLHITEEDTKKLRRDSNNMIDRVSSIFDTGKKPRTIVATIIYMCALSNNMDIDMREISIATNVCSQSIGKCLTFIKKEYNIDF